MHPDTVQPSYDILFQTDHELVVYKPEGMACEKRIDLAGESLVAKLTRRFNQQMYLPHRIDAVTCGLVLVARSKAAVAFHNRQIADGLWEKHYIAKVEWKPELSAPNLLGPHKAFLKRKGNQAVVVKSGGAPSFLKILAIEEIPDHPDARRVLIQLLTGRYHQIRVMCQSLGIPLCGDPLYGNPDHPQSFYLEHAALAFTDMAGHHPQRIVTPIENLAEQVNKALYSRLLTSERS